jgi:VCBS repeat-containing protein
MLVVGKSSPILADLMDNPPVTMDDAYSTNKDATLNIAAPGVLSNDTDPDGDNLTAAKVSDPSHGMLTLNNNGSFDYIPSSGYTGTDSFTYQANDGQANSNSANVTISIATITTTVGVLSLSPSFENISVISSFSGDDNGNNQATLYYKESSASIWKPGIQMTVDRRDQLVLSGSGSIANPYKNQWRAVIFWLTPVTSYDVRVTYTDADGGSGQVQGTVTTLNDNPPSSGKTYYVATSGNDTSDGSQPTPWLTIGKAASSAAAGDTVKIMPGTYDEQVVISKSGTVNNYITFKSYDSSNKAIVTSSVDTGTFRLSDVSYIRLKELDIRNTGEYMGVFIEGTNAIGNIVEDCNLTCVGYNWWSAGVWVTDGASRTLVQRNQIITTTSAAGDGPQGVYMVSTGGNTVIRDNHITGKYNNAIGGEDNSSVNGGPYLNTYIYGNTIDGADGDGIEADGGGINCAIWSNTIKNTGYSGISLAPIIVGPTYVFRNTVLPSNILTSVKLGSSSYGYIYLYHNTFYVVSGYANGMSTFGNDAIVYNAVFRNNIIQASDYLIEELENGTGTMDFDYDCMYTSDGMLKWRDTVMTWANWRTNYGKETHGILGQPGVVNAANGDLSLQSSSPCIDKGVVLAGFNDANSPWPYRGSAPDMGAYEYDSGAPTNSPPVAVNDAYSTSMNTTLNISAPGVLGNDTDVNGDTLTAVLVSGVSHGSLTLNNNGSFSYIPSTGYTGTEFFTYRASDGQVDSNTAIVTITTTGINNPPVAVNDAYSTNEDTALNTPAPGVLSNDTDADGDTLTVAKVTNPSHGTVTLNNNGSFTYTPDPGYSGTDSFTYKANDDQADSNVVTVTITINAKASSEDGGGGSAGGGGGGGGGGSVVGEKRLNSIFSITTKIFKLGEDVEALSYDDKVKVFLKTGTEVKNAQGSFVTSIVIEKLVSPPSATTNTEIIGSVYDIGPSGATFDPPITITFSYDPNNLPLGTIEQNLSLAWFDKNANEWNVLEDNVVDTLKHTITSHVSHFTPYAIILHQKPAPSAPTPVTPAAIPVLPEPSSSPIPSEPMPLLPTPASTPAPAPASFTISELSITPNESRPAEGVTISALVTNTGGSDGSYTVILQINGLEERTKEVTIGAGKSETVSFTIARDTEGVFVINVNGKTGQFTVVVPQPPTQSPVESLLVQSSTNRGLIAGIVTASVTVIIGIVYGVVRRRRNTWGQKY